MIDPQDVRAYLANPQMRMVAIVNEKGVAGWLDAVEMAREWLRMQRALEGRDVTDTDRELSTTRGLLAHGCETFGPRKVAFLLSILDRQEAELTRLRGVETEACHGDVLAELAEGEEETAP